LGGEEGGEGGADGLVGLEADETLDGFEGEVALFSGEGAFGIEVLQLLGGGLGAGVFVLGEDEGFAAEAGEGIEHAGVVSRVFVELFVAEGFEDLGDGELDDGAMHVERVLDLEEIGRAFAQGIAVLEPLLVADVVLVAGVEPVGQVFAVEHDAVFGELGFDGFVGGAVIEQAVIRSRWSLGRLGILPRWRRGVGSGESKVEDGDGGGGESGVSGVKFTAVGASIGSAVVIFLIFDFWGLIRDAVDSDKSRARRVLTMLVGENLSLNIFEYL